MQSEEVRKLVFDTLCLEFEKHGTSAGLNLDSLFTKLNKDGDVKKSGGVTFGLVEASLSKLREEKIVYFNNTKRTYRATPEAFVKWSDSKRSKTHFDAGKEWSPLQVQNHEQVADAVDEVAKLLEAENGYIANHPIEAEHTITTSKNLSSSLRDNEGAALLKQLDYFVTLMERVIAIFDKGSRIGKAVNKLVIYISSLIF